MTDYVPDVKKYTATVNEAAVAAIVKYCGIALRRPDSSTVSATDPKEMPPCAMVSRPRNWG